MGPTDDREYKNVPGEGRDDLLSLVPADGKRERIGKHMTRRTAAAVGLAAIATSLWLAPMAHAGSQYLRTQSGAVRCVVLTDDQGHGGGPAVACEHGPGFPQAPVSQYGTHFNDAVIHASGKFFWEDANIGGGGTPQNDLVLTYGQTFHILGWTVVPNSDGTRFTDDGSGHGMFVSIDNVSPF